MLQKALFHLHTNYSYDALNTVSNLLETCHNNDIKVLAVTEHNNMDSYIPLKNYIKEQNFSIKLIPGEEIATRQGEVIGLFLQEAIPKGLSLKETVQEIKRQKAVVYVPHPFDSFRKERIRNPQDLDSVIDDVDIIEVFNSRNFGGNGKASSYAKEYNKLALWGSDAHFPAEILNCITGIPDFELERESFLKSVQEAQVIHKKRSFTGAIKSHYLKRKIINSNSSIKYVAR